MIANATEVKNNFGKYLRMTSREDVIKKTALYARNGAYT